MIGRVRWFNPTFGYGFIWGPNGEDVFVHYSEIVSLEGEERRNLHKNQLVGYCLTGELGKLKAVSVKRLKKA